MSRRRRSKNFKKNSSKFNGRSTNKFLFQFFPTGTKRNVFLGNFQVKIRKSIEDQHELDIQEKLEQIRRVEKEKLRSIEQLR